MLHILFNSKYFGILQKLHILADIGISFLNSLGNISFSSSHTPGLILLPKSLYKISSGYKCQVSFSSSFSA